MSNGQLPAWLGSTQSSSEDQEETLKCMIKAPRQNQKKKVLEEFLDQQFKMQDDVDHSDDHLYLNGSNSIVTERLKERLAEATLNVKNQHKKKFPQPVSCFRKLDERETIMSDQEADRDQRERRDTSLIRNKRVEFIRAGRLARPLLGTAKESYDFFTFNFEPDPQCENKKKSGTGTDKGDDRQIKGQGGAKADSPSKAPPPEIDNKIDLFITQLSPHLLQVRKAEYVGYKKCIQQQGELLFKPSLRTVPSYLKLPENKKPRRLEEEGLCVGKRPPVSLANENLLENRILKTNEGKKWFGDDGRIIALPDPIKKSSTQSPLLHMETDLDSELQPVYRKAVNPTSTGPYLPGAEELKGDFQLDIDVSGLEFSHHPLFSREHVLGARLTQLYDLYLSRQHNNLTGHLTDKLKGLRKAMQDMLGSQGVTEAKQQRISDYTLEIRNTRQLRDSEQEKDRTLLQDIVEVWKEIKALRRSQKYTSTTYKLCYRRENVDREKDEQEYEEEIMSEILDLELELEEEYRRKLLTYKLQLQEWNAWRNKQESEEKVSKKKVQPKGSNKQEHDDQEYGQSEETLEKAPPKPEPPEKLPLESIEKQIRAKASRIRRKPGEAILIPVLYTSGNITPTELCPPAEENRRNEVAKLSFFIRVLYNNKEVSQTEKHFLSSNFKLHFGKIFNLKILNFPQSINLQVFEGTGLSHTLLDQVFIPVPQPSVLTGQVPLKKLEFSSNQRGIFESSSQIAPTSGKLSCCASWGVSEDGLPLAPPVARKPGGTHNYRDAVSHGRRSGLYTMNNLEQAAHCQLDPNDPVNTSIIQLLKVDRKVINPENLQLETLQEDFNFANDEELEGSKRFQMLQLRNQGVAGFQNYKFIPALENEVTREMCQELDEGLKEGEIIDTNRYLDADQALAAKHLLKMRKLVSDRFSCAKYYCGPADMGITEMRPKTEILMVNLLKLTKPRRQLKPERRERTKITTQNLSDGDVKVLVNVIRGYNIPIRWPQSSQRSFEDRELFLTQVQVRPFVEVSFQHTVLQTSTAEGRNPSWNQQLQLPVKAPYGSYSASSLQSVRDEVFINIFDEIVYNTEVTDRQTGKTVRTQVEKRWLGFVKFPFSTIYSQSRIDGTFKVNTPAVLLGYSKEENQNRNGISYAWFSSQIQEPYITLFITIEPMLVPAKFIKETFDSEEDESLLKASKEFEKEASVLCPERPCITNVINLNGSEVFITRYIQPLNPPIYLLEGLSSNSQDAMVARYVSLIPSLSDRGLFSASCELWSTCDQFLTHLAGDKADHAVLLCNYFLYIKKRAWLIIGSAIPEGQTAYVLTHEESRYLIWNPRSGQSYTQYDAFCPLQTVGSLVNGDNLWLNIQKHTSPMRVSFDIMKTNLWKPFFSASFPNTGLLGKQLQRLVYQPPDKEAAVELQRRIEKTVRDKFMEWRPHQPTHWNRYCISVLRQFLPKLELSERECMAERHCHKLQKLLGDTRISGFPLHQPFSDMEHIIKAVQSTGVHNIQEPNVEFALAVYVHPYPNSILSVWVYLASLVRT
uniref:Coiled-coil and C2 domain containing 2A n=1 Tax=Takifugu rubripes TaxID=31033 RepID=A0A3B5KVH3_TAKRU